MASKIEGKAKVSVCSCNDIRGQITPKYTSVLLERYVLSGNTAVPVITLHSLSSNVIIRK